ncbi:rho guanine nucleotide exchange factor 28 isoform X1 [Pieris rapae]|uniref:rho guanine nucleotide exchange factor 28 isoform X1 n=2 Tax=Pieris rapae TaxID=64459 RepID=UPI001E27E214|nr:rho guanine nucleotide exchange factor 28 isoform X1 [Pieris rapae]XP_045484822.1 rho guanine nucleotide exchange factor 28 isoform X1 [Pieris rapae]
MNVQSQENVRLISSDEGDGSSDSRSDSSEDEVTEHVTATPPPNMAAARAQVPTISVTPHSPGVLDDSLQQLRRLHAAVQRMRAAPLPLLAIGTSRLSTSCPSLCKDGVVETECSSPTHLDFYPQSRKGSGESRQWMSWERRDEGRRSSWAALEPAPPQHDTQRHRGALNGHSASLSSMESEGDAPRPVRHSTHSLNDNDLAKEFEKVTAALRGASTAVPSSGSSRLLARLPLQKSVSTPSIVAAVQPPQPPPPVNILSAGGASETESDEDASAATVGATQLTGRRNNSHQEHLGLHRLAFLEQASYDHHAEKRRKRGSLFFRKKKDKSRKAAHVWQAAVAGGHCDWCQRELSDKPALYCENCTMTVHQNVCKDYIVECNKPKSSKTTVGKSLSASSGKSSKRSSVSGQSQNSNSTSIYNDEKDGSDHKHDQSNASDDGVMEWPEVYITSDQLGEEAIVLGLGAAEPETWAAGAPKGLAKSIGERETKRQEHIYELILTEKHHCLTIRLMQKMFVEGMTRLTGITDAQVSRMFPRLDELWYIHAALLSRLRARQRTAPRVNTIADILADAFASPDHHTLKAAYGEFCSRHRDAVEVFKECCAREPKLARFIRKCQQNPLLRKKGVPECVLFVAQRLTKYPLLLEPLLKTAGDDLTERELLQKALCGVKEILVDVDNQVAAKEREDRKLEIYHRIDAKSFANFRGRKFKKSDILQGNRSLKFEGVATLMQGRSKMQTLMVIVLTDVLFFLQDNNNKYTFFTPDNKTGVVSLCKVLVREKAGADGRGLYIICSGPSDPEMFELRVHRPKDIANWIHAIRAAVQSCPEEVEESETGPHVPSAEEKQRLLEARHENIRLITEALRSKDKEHAVLLEEKMALHMKMFGHTGASTLELPNTDLTTGVTTVFPGGLVFPDYVRVAAPTPDTHALWQEVCKVVKDALEVCNAYSTYTSHNTGGVAVGRSTSSAGEKHSLAYESPALPRRADTFAGFDANKHRAQGVTPRMSTDTPTEVESAESREAEVSGREAALKLQHAIYTLTCIVWQQLTTIHSLEAQVCAWRSSGGNAARTHDAQLEELRHAQSRLTADRAAWEAQRTADRDALATEKRQLQAMREQLEEQQKDVEQQRERLYRRLERLQQHGGSQEEIASVGTLSPDSSVSDTHRRKEPKWRSFADNRGSTGSESGASVCSSRGPPLPPPQLLSAQNETRAIVRAPVQQMVKQQLPLKLASGKSQMPPPGYHRLHESPSDHHQGVVIHHTRTGSSPAQMPSQQPATNKATRTNTYPKLPDKFRVRSPDSNPLPPPPAPNPPEEEVIYF